MEQSQQKQRYEFHTKIGHFLHWAYQKRHEYHTTNIILRIISYQKRHGHIPQDAERMQQQNIIHKLV